MLLPPQLHSNQRLNRITMKNRKTYKSTPIPYVSKIFKNSNTPVSLHSVIEELQKEHPKRDYTTDIEIVGVDNNEVIIHFYYTESK